MSGKVGTTMCCANYFNERERVIARASRNFTLSFRHPGQKKSHKNMMLGAFFRENGKVDVKKIYKNGYAGFWVCEQKQ
jgi:hypothetical protein